MRWYTAVGVKMEHLGGLFCVQVGTENKILSGMEIFIWNALLWSFVGRNTDLREDGTVVKGCISGKGSGWENRKG